MRKNLAFLLVSPFLVSLVNASEANPWQDQKITAHKCRTPQIYSPKESLKDLVIEMNTGTVQVKNSKDDTLSFQASGEKEDLKNIIFSLSSKGLTIKDNNNPEKYIPETNNYNNFDDFNNFKEIFGGEISGTISLGSTTVIQNGRKKITHTGLLMSSTGSGNPDLVTQQCLSNYGAGSTFGKIILNHVTLENVNVGSKGIIQSGKIIKGSVEQNGKIYPVGTIFSQGTPYRPDISNVLLSSESQALVDAPKPKKKTVITIYLPKSFQNWEIILEGKGNSQTHLKDLTAHMLQGNFCDKAVFKISKGQYSKLVALEGTGNTKLKGNKFYTDSLKLKGSNKAKFNFTQKEAQNFQDLGILSSDYSEIYLNGQNSNCKNRFSIIAEDSSKITIENLFVMDLGAKISAHKYGKITSNASFYCFNLLAEDSSKITITEFEKAATKKGKEIFKDPSLFSKVTLKDYSKVKIQDWHNKLETSN